MTMSNNINHGQFGDTTFTKVFVGGLAWKTSIEAMKDHFDQFGEIFEAVIISDKLTGRSKGYGFVTFKDAEAAKKACEDASPIINGRRANGNLASLGASRPNKQSISNTPPPIPPTYQYGQGIYINVSGRPRCMSSAPSSHVQWYYPTAGTPACPFHDHHQYMMNHQAVPLYGYTPAYIAPDHYSYNHKQGGEYMRGNYSQVYGTGQAIMGANNTMMPMYQPLYHYHHQSHTMGLPSHMFPVATILISKPPSIATNNTGSTMSTSESCKKFGYLSWQ